VSGFNYSGTPNLIRANVWSSQTKEVLLEELMAMRYLDMVTDFPDGDTINIPSIGQAEVLDYAEGQAVRYTAMATGNFTFSINKYKSTATYISERMKQDSFYMSRLVASFVPKQARAIMKSLEVDVLAIGPTSQTASSLNPINGASHRFVGSGTNAVITPADFARAKYALQKANVPMTNLTALVDPSVEFTLSTLTNLTNVQNNPRWEGVVKDGFSTGTKFIANVYGFDVYTTPNLTQQGAETINSVAANSSAVSNIFFSAAPDVLPFIGSLRQPPKVDTDYNKDLQREEYVTTCRYGVKLYRPENIVTVITATDQV
jgi:hypothetical protein